MRVMDAKLNLFISQTGAEPALARDLLEGNEWNVENAVKVYKLMQNSALPPAGMPKNLEPKRNNMAAVSGGRVTGVPVTGGGMPGSRPVNHTDINPSRKPGAIQRQAVSPDVARKLKRGLSKTSENLALVLQARDLVLHDIEEDATDLTPHFVETPDLTFVLPNLTVYSEDFRAFLHKDLIETSTLVSLEQAGRLNWSADIGACQRLLPLATTGDGNCLLHAASLGMWGFHDRLLTLRKALYTTLTTSGSKSALWRRWRWHQTQANKESGLVYSEDEWETEWQNLLKLASAKPRTTPGSNTSCCSGPVTKGLMERTMERDSNNTQMEVFYESLEEFHVFVLAHVLRRPIVVVADTILKDSNGEALAPIPFGGLYLPLECSPSQCHRTPLLLTYDASHFSALVAMDTEASPEDKPGIPAAIPLVDPEFQLLPIHYIIDPGENYVWGKNEQDILKTSEAEEQLVLIKQYLDLESIPIPARGTPVHQNNLLVDVDLGAQPRSRSNSHSGSVDSDENNSIGSSGSMKDGKEREKSKVAKQMQTVAKSFGSIGKTMSKKLKKNFGGVGKVMKEEKLRDKDKKRLRLASVGTVTQSTKVTSVTTDLLCDKDLILCVRLSHKRMEYQEEMVRNYLLAAQERFKRDRELRRQQDVEMKLKVELRSSREVLHKDLERDPEAVDEVDRGVRIHVEGSGGILSPRMQCINNGCDLKGSASTSYLCPSCYEKEKQQAFDFERGPVAADGRPILGGAAMPLERKDTLLTCGKSKFYTLSDEDHYGNVSHVNLAAKQLKHPPIPNKLEGTQQDNAELNNTKLLRDKKNSYLNAPTGGIRIARSTFYDEMPAEGKPAAAPTVTVSSSGECGTQGLPLGTAYIMNDLQHQPQPHITGVGQPANDHMFGLVTNSTSDTILEPPLRPEFQLNGLGKPQLAKLQKVEDVKVSKVNPKLSISDGTMQVSHGRQKCKTTNCPFYGTDSSDSLCSACFRKKQQQSITQQAAKSQAMR